MSTMLASLRARLSSHTRNINAKVSARVWLRTVKVSVNWGPSNFTFGFYFISPDLTRSGSGVLRAHRGSIDDTIDCRVRVTESRPGGMTSGRPKQKRCRKRGAKRTRGGIELRLPVTGDDPTSRCQTANRSTGCSSTIARCILPSSRPVLLDGAFFLEIAMKAKRCVAFLVAFVLMVSGGKASAQATRPPDGGKD